MRNRLILSALLAFSFIAVAQQKPDAKVEVIRSAGHARNRQLAVRRRRQCVSA